MRWWLRPDCSSSSASVARRNSRSGAPSKLEPTSSRSAFRFRSVNGKSGCPDLNWGPLRPERSALPDCATARGGLKGTEGSAGDGVVVAQREAREQRLEAGLDREVLLIGVGAQAGTLDRLALADHLVHEIGMLV